ncbi:myb/SANT-like DNA-binding domain-containing protein 3 isoform X1 [Penaeus chinensis]|uniref:myb/SANT-like DNA-binding domain-containing protein 3 isoform X1 n=1 Tax=Penaeus chinensis TaxID=139456 RepID=UPI001FB6BA8B|nr:myb/SANT-like DNA-binding domain-containing protein 3 isoform X1 [Penaeus chinensis]
MAPRRCFTAKDKALLSVLVKTNPILQSHAADATTAHKKARKWKEIAEIYNANCKGQKRNVEQLRKCWKNMKFKEKQFAASAANAVNNGGGLSQLQDANSSSELDDPIHLESDDEPEYILPSVHDDSPDLIENSMQEDVFHKTGCTIVEGLENAVIVEDDHNLSDHNSPATFVRILPKPPSTNLQSNDIGEDSRIEYSAAREMSSHIVADNLSRPGSANSSASEPQPPKPKQTRKVPKTTVLKYSKNSGELNNGPLTTKITEKIMSSEYKKKMEYLDLKVKLLLAEEERKKEKHKKEMYLLNTQIQYWKERRRDLSEDLFVVP